MNKKGQLGKVLLTLIVVAILTVITAWMIQKNIVDKSDSFADLQQCNNLPLGKEGVCVNSRVDCTNMEGTVFPGNNCEENKICCIIGLFDTT